MDLFNAALTGLFDALFWPLGDRPWLVMIVISALTGMMMLVIFKLTSNQAGIRREKDRLKAFFLEIWLYRDDFRMTMGTTTKIFRTNFSYMRHSVVPMLFMIPPLVLILVQLNLRYGFQPLNPGQHTVVQVDLVKDSDPRKLQVDLPPEVKSETPPVSIRALAEKNWRIHGTEPGRYELRFRYEGAETTKSLVVDGGFGKISDARVSSTWEALLFPSEPKLAAPFERIKVHYVPDEMVAFGWQMHWIIPFFILSIVFGFALKDAFGVEV